MRARECWLDGFQDVLRDISPLRRAGAGVLALTLGKTVLETVTGAPFFAALHLGDIGTPLVQCHLGGVLGGVLGALAFPGRGTNREASGSEPTTLPMENPLAPIDFQP